MPLDEAKETVDRLVQDVKNSYPALNLSVSWNGDRTAAEAKGKMFKGSFKVSANEVSVDINLSALAGAFKGKVEKRIDQKLTEFFG
jgi:hypothetical protein